MKQKKVYLELLRIICSWFVVFNHLPAMYLLTTTTGVLQDIHLIIRSVIIIAVPVFLMISGTVLLGKKEDIKTVFKNRVSKAFMTMFLIELGMYLLIIIRSLYKQLPITEKPISTFIFGFIHGDLPSLEAYWYLYLNLAFLISLPLLQRITVGYTKQDFKFWLFLHFFYYTLMPTINVFFDKWGIGVLDVAGALDIPFALTQIYFYPFMGYYLDRNVDTNKMEKKHVLGLILGLIFVQLLCVLAFHNKMSIGPMFDYIVAIIIFILIKYLVERVLPNLSNWESLSKKICLIGSLTYGIYLFHIPVNYVLAGVWHTKLEPIIGTFFTSFIWVFISMAICGTITYFLKKIPGIKKLL